MASPLEDLDELTLRCRDDKARAHIYEAVASYRAGAFRSTIVATWIAVCFDLIEKLRELTLAGDKEAEQQVQGIEKTHRTNDMTAALKFEREILVLAKDKFELLSPIEYEDLKRLQEDRNRCAHPSLSSDDQAYTPPAELARLHIHSAVIHLLQHPPVQGKYALDRLLKEIDSDYFPSTADAAKVAFNAGPLRRPRDSLVRSLVVVLCKVLLNDKPNWKRRGRIAAALQAIEALHPAPSAKTKKESLSTLFRKIEDKDMSVAISFLKSVPDTWQYLEHDIRHRLQNFVLTLDQVNFTHHIDFLIEYQPLKEQALLRIKRASKEDLMETWAFFNIPKEVLDRFIAIYKYSRTFEEANEWAKEMLPYSGEFSANQIRSLITVAAGNIQIRHSFQLGPLISKLRSNNKLQEEEFEELLLENGLNEYCLTNNGDEL